MAMSEVQRTAFEISAGSSVLTSANVWMGITFVIAFTWSAWVFLQVYKGWAKESLDGGTSGSAILRVLMIDVLLIFFWLS